MTTMSLARKGAIILGAALALATLTGSAEARWYGCWGCGAFAAGAIAGAVDDAIGTAASRLIDGVSAAASSGSVATNVV